MGVATFFGAEWLTQYDEQKSKACVSFSDGFAGSIFLQYGTCQYVFEVWPFNMSKTTYLSKRCIKVIRWDF